MKVQDLLKEISIKTKVEYDKVDETAKALVVVMNDGDYSTVGKLSKMLRALKKKKDVITIAKKTSESTGISYDETYPVVEYLLNVMKKTMSTGGIPALMKVVKDMKARQKEEKSQKKKEDSKK